MRVYAGINYLTNTTERQLEGVVGTNYSITVSQGDPVEASLTALYGNETPNASITPSSFETEPEPLIFHQGQMNIGGTNQTLMEEAELEISPNARFQRGWNQHPQEAVLGGVETSLTMSKVITGTDLRAEAYGGSGGPQTQVNGPTANLSLQTPGTSGLTFNVTDFAKPSEYGWTNFIDAENDAMEDVTFTAGHIEATASSSESSAL
ncbi:phage tail tube protein [Haladaptatus pallidirubidus]